MLSSIPAGHIFYPGQSMGFNTRLKDVLSSKPIVYTMFIVIILSAILTVGLATFSLVSMLRLPCTNIAKINEKQNSLHFSLNTSVTNHLSKKLRGVYLTKWSMMSKVCIHLLRVRRTTRICENLCTHDREFGIQ